MAWMVALRVGGGETSTRVGLAEGLGDEGTLRVC